MGKYIICIFFFGLSLGLTGCFGGQDHQDLRDFIEETKRRPQGEIEPIPVFRPSDPFTYSASRLRNPFEPPVGQPQTQLVGLRTDVKPDLNRPKELLENFNFASLSMVGTFEKSGTLWALIDDSEGEIHYIKVGNYMGKNHGKVVATTKSQVDIIEIVTDGLDGWVERPRTLKLKEKE